MADADALVLERKHKHTLSKPLQKTNDHYDTYLAGPRRDQQDGGDQPKTSKIKKATHHQRNQRNEAMYVFPSVLDNAKTDMFFKVACVEVCACVCVCVCANFAS